MAHSTHKISERAASAPSPFDRLPPEVISTIFLYCPKDLIHPHPRADDPPLNLCLVCRYWRKVALTSPWLWSGITLSGGLVAPGKDWPQTQQGLREWIQRSRSLPLVVLCDLQDIAEPVHLTADVVAMFFPHVHRWRSISGHLRNAHAEPLFGALAHGAPLLEVLSLSFRRQGRKLPVIDISLAPPLRVVSIKGLLLRPLFPSGVLHSLQKLSIGWAITPDDLFLCFTRCPSLVESSANIHQQSSTSTLPSEEVAVLPQLSVFKLRATSSRGLEPLLASIHLPALTYLKLSSFYIRDCPEFRAFIVRSQPNLEKLILKGLKVGDDGILAALAHAPRLSDLYLDRAGNMDAAIRALTPDCQSSSPASILCPNLTQVTIRQCTITVDAVRDLILMRWTHLHRGMQRDVIDVQDADANEPDRRGECYGCLGTLQFRLVNLGDEVKLLRDDPDIINITHGLKVSWT